MRYEPSRFFANKRYKSFPKNQCATHPDGVWGEGYLYCSKGYLTKDCVKKPKSWGYLTEPI